MHEFISVQAAAVASAGWLAPNFLEYRVEWNASSKAEANAHIVVNKMFDFRIHAQWWHLSAYYFAHAIPFSDVVVTHVATDFVLTHTQADVHKYTSLPETIPEISAHRRRLTPTRPQQLEHMCLSQYLCCMCINLSVRVCSEAIVISVTNAHLELYSQTYGTNITPFVWCMSLFIEGLATEEAEECSQHCDWGGRAYILISCNWRPKHVHELGLRCCICYKKIWYFVSGYTFAVSIWFNFSIFIQEMKE